ncbi:MAG: hypothetical protein QP763_00845 [Peptoniphilus duerdenii]|uniref:hypothetical protein n=1 Tax=Peptoniphilus duerdenii TaxID=507750 RepID=UPI002550BF74|nr:hypothetical protein [Peptoniphilus duerdenii]MDK8275603.1 hypothetical protein [Peptoniphilus duerdenii]
MILLENKIAIFNKIVYLEREKDCEARIEATKEEIESTLQKKKKELQDMKKELIDRRIYLANEKKYEMIGKANEMKRIKKLEKADELVGLLIDGVYEKIKSYVKEDSYNDEQINRFKKLLDNLQEGSYIVHVLDVDVELKKSMEDLAREKGIKLNFVSLDQKKLGGFIILDEEMTYSIDKSLYKILDDNRYEIGKMLHFALKG